MKMEKQLPAKDYEELCAIRINVELIDFYFPRCLRDDLEGYCARFGCDMKWRHDDGARVPHIGVLSFDAKSKYRLMDIDEYTTDIFDELAEICMYNSLMIVGIPAADARGWIKTKTKNKERYITTSISSYIDAQVSTNPELRCVDVTQLQSYRSQLQKYKFKQTKKSGAQAQKHSMEMDQTEEPPKKKQRV